MVQRVQTLGWHPSWQRLLWAFPRGADPTGPLCAARPGPGRQGCPGGGGCLSLQLPRRPSPRPSLETFLIKLERLASRQLRAAPSSSEPRRQPQEPHSSKLNGACARGLVTGCAAPAVAGVQGLAEGRPWGGQGGAILPQEVASDWASDWLGDLRSVTPLPGPQRCRLPSGGALTRLGCRLRDLSPRGLLHGKSQKVVFFQMEPGLVPAVTPEVACGQGHAGSSSPPAEPSPVLRSFAPLLSRHQHASSPG